MPLEPSEGPSGFLLLRGRGMSPGRAAGALCRNRRTLDPGMVSGRILVAERAVPEDLGRILASSGTVTIAATLLSHVSLLSREFGKPSVSFGPGSSVRLLSEPDSPALLAPLDVVGSGAPPIVEDGDLVLLDGDAGTVAIPLAATAAARASLSAVQRRLTAYGLQPDDRHLLAALLGAMRRGGADVVPYSAEAALAYRVVPRGEPTRRLLDAVSREADLRDAWATRVAEIGTRVEAEIDRRCRETVTAVGETADPEELERILRAFETGLASRFALLEDLALAGDEVEPRLERVLVAANERRRALRIDLERDVDGALAAEDGALRTGLGGIFRLLRRARAAHLERAKVEALHRRLSGILSDERKRIGTQLVVPLTPAARVGRETIGGKAAGLIEVIGLLPAGCAVPSGFVVTAAAYRLHLLGETGERMRTAVLESPDPVELSRRARAAILSGAVPAEVVEAVSEALAAHGVARLAVRSSATIEDGPVTSLAGLFDTYLGVTGVEAVLERTRWAWSSLWNARALAALDASGLAPFRASQAVLVQEMVSATVAGVFFSSDPSGRPDTMLVNAWWGLGEGISQGEVPGDAFWVRRSTGRTLATECCDAPRKVMLDPSGPGTVEVPLDPGERGRPCLAEEDLARLAELARTLEKRTGRSQDVEFGFDASGVLHVFQIRRVVPVRGA